MPPHSQLNRPFADADVRPRLDEIVYSSLAPVCWVLATLYLIHSAASTFFDQTKYGWLVAALGMLTAVLLAAIPFKASARDLTSRYAHPLGACAGGLLLANFALNLSLSGDPAETINFIVLAIGTGSFLLRRRWMVALMLTILVTWVGVAWYHQAFQAWVGYGIALLKACLIGVAVFFARRQTLIQLERVRLHDQHTAQQVKMSEARFRQLANATSEGVLVHSDGVVVDANVVVEELFGYTHEEIVGYRLEELFSAPDRSLAQTAVEAAPASLHSLHGLRKDGSLFPLELRTRELAGGSLGVATIMDMTQSLKADKMKEEFVSVVSHELRTPLTSIRGALGLLTTPQIAQDPDRVRQLIGVARNNAERLIRLINDILDLRKLESGEVTVETKPCTASSVVRQAVNEMLGLAETSSVKLHVHTEEAHMVADPDRLVQTLTNLIGNAIKFSPPDSTVSVAAEVRERDVLFRVTDQGRGIPKDKLEMIFERFQQVDATDSRRKGGTGLGLSICRAIVQQHEGRIWAESNGQGSTFSFTIPRRSPAVRTPRPNDAVASAAS